MIPGFAFIQGVIQIRKIMEEEKRIKADKENQRAKDCGAKSINLYAEMLNGVKMTEEKVRGKKFKEYCMITESVSKEEIERRYPIDTVMGELHDSIDPLKYSKPDITITKAQAELVSELIDFYIDRRAGSPAFNEDSLISLMSKLNVSGL